MCLFSCVLEKEFGIFKKKTVNVTILSYFYLQVANARSYFFKGVFFNVSLNQCTILTTHSLLGVPKPGQMWIAAPSPAPKNFHFACVQLPTWQ